MLTPLLPHIVYVESRKNAINCKIFFYIFTCIKSYHPFTIQLTLEAELSETREQLNDAKEQLAEKDKLLADSQKALADNQKTLAEKDSIIARQLAELAKYKELYGNSTDTE